MVTYRHGGAVLLFVGSVCATACGMRAGVEPDPSPTGSAAGQDGGADPGAPRGTYVPGAAVPEAAYPGHGFVVHEWGTNTIVVGSDGSVQRGLHHEEEDLPDFVYDRIKSGGMPGSVEVKMETPVLYFYSEAARDVRVDVAFPAGVMTQWYPMAQSFAPMVADLGSGIVDPVMDPHYAFRVDACAQRFGDGKAIKEGLLSWGAVHVGGRSERAAVPDAPLDRYTWSHARAVDANPLRVDNGAGGHDEERFLFYRGLGNFSLAASVTSGGDASSEGRSGVAIVNHDAAHPLGSVFVLDVGATSARFVVHPEGLPAAHGALVESLTSAAPAPLDAFVDALAAAMTAELDRTGLYHDEAVAMVSTWRRQWFRTPGRRVLYLAPQAWTDAQIPLAVDPVPDVVTRVMVIRTEVITTDQEDADVQAATSLEGDSSANGVGIMYFRSLGRFAEPRLRRARQLLGDAAGPSSAALLGQIAGANTDIGIGE